jgi:hypothetical protein
VCEIATSETMKDEFVSRLDRNQSVDKINLLMNIEIHLQCNTIQNTYNALIRNIRVKFRRPIEIETDRTLQINW